MLKPKLFFLLLCVLVNSVFSSAQTPKTTQEKNIVATLISTIDEARANDYALQNAILQNEHDRLGTALARSALLPQLSLSASNTTIQSDRSDAAGSGVFEVFTNTGSTDATSNALALTAQWALLDVSALQATRAASLRAQGAQAILTAQQQEFLLRTARTYLQTLQAYRLHNAAEAQEGSIRKQYEQVNERKRVGLATQNEVEEAKAALDSSVADSILSEVQIDISLEELYKVTGRDYDVLAPICAWYHPSASDLDTEDALLDKALEHNPYLLAARANAQAAKASLKSAKSAALPKLNLSANIDSSDFNSDFTLSETNEISNQAYADEQSQLSLSLNVPLFSGGSISASNKRAKAQFGMANNQLLEAQRNIRSQVRTLRRQLLAQSALSNARKQAQKSAQLAYNATQIGYNTGTRNIVELVQSASGLYQAQAGYYQARINYLILKLQLDAVLGQLNVDAIANIDNLLVPYNANGVAMPCQNSQR